MRRFLVEVVVDAVLIFVVGFLLSLIWVPQAFPFGSGSAPILTRVAAEQTGPLATVAVVVIFGVLANSLLVGYRLSRPPGGNGRS